MYALALLTSLAFADLPEGAMKALRGYEVKASAACDVGADHVEVFGAVVSKSQKLAPVMLKKAGKSYRVLRLDNNAEGKNGKVNGFVQNKIVCADPLKNNDPVYAKLGEFKVRDTLRTGSHLCFSASSTYNDWVCYTWDSKARKPVQSFIQLLAD